MLRERYPYTGIQRLGDTLKLDHQGSGICKNLGKYRDRNTQTQRCTNVRSHAKTQEHAKIQGLVKYQEDTKTQ